MYVCHTKSCLQHHFAFALYMVHMQNLWPAHFKAGHPISDSAQLSSQRDLQTRDTVLFIHSALPQAFHIGTSQLLC